MLTVPALLLMATAPSAQVGAAGGTVVLVQPSEAASWPAAEARLSAELAAMGFVVVRAAGRAERDTDRRLELLRLAESHHALAVVRIRRLAEGAGVDLWVADRQTGKLRTLALGADDPARPAVDPAFVALHVVEMLTGALLELGVQTAPRVEVSPEATTPPTPTPTPEPAPEPALRSEASAPSPSPIPPMTTSDKVSTWGLAAGGVVGGATGGLGPTGGMRLAIRWHPSTTWWLEGEGVVCAWLSAVRAEDARARLNGGLARLSIGAPLASLDRLVLELSAGAGAMGLLGAGQADPPLVARTVAAGSVAVHGSVGASLPLTSAVGLRLTTTVAHVWPSVDITFGPRQVARVGPWLVDGALALTLQL